ncbi:MAG: YqaJ viral recombinase family protein [Coriobacteriia bacterium]|nr:YqaJ viral recombinase family protein [Coriobacteriia bacterium]
MTYERIDLKYDRTTGVGGSDAAAAIGQTTWKSPLKLWLEKTGRETPDDLSADERIYWGTRLEAVVISEFALHHPEYAVWQPERAYRSTVYPWATATPDALLEGLEDATGVLEVKTADGTFRKQYKAGEIPMQYRVQLLHNMAVLDASFGWLAVLVGGNTYFEFELKRDAVIDAEIARLMELESQFWTLVEADQSPKLVGIKDEGRALATLYPDPDTTVINETSDEVITAVLDYVEAAEAIREAEAVKALSANIIKSAIGDNYGLTTGLYRMTWLRKEAEKLDTKRLKAEKPEVFRAYQKTYIHDSGIRFREVE